MVLSTKKMRLMESAQIVESRQWTEMPTNVADIRRQSVKPAGGHLVIRAAEADKLRAT